ncbi:hypothetical protein DWV34_11675 [Anaerostipes sp. AF04-45]|nr:hypothetical protein DWV34_11675 [Anaerostipes sp. AF04-45]
MPHSNHVENGRNVCWRRVSAKKGATFRKLFITIGGAHFKSATEIVVNNSYYIFLFSHYLFFPLHKKPIISARRNYGFS